jgi:hypothetical protein
MTVGERGERSGERERERLELGAVTVRRGGRAVGGV